MKLEKHIILAILLFVFYTVGIIGLKVQLTRDIFLILTPVNLLLTLGLMTWAIKRKSLKYYIGFILAFLIGFIVEVAGVKTGLLFGEYSYGHALGPQLFETPLMIGVNWFLLAYASASMSRNLVKNQILRIIIASALMVLLDILIEPVAIELNFWQWSSNEIPIQNYLMWFVVSILIQTVFYWIKLRPDRQAGVVVLAFQFYFFMVLNMFL